MEPAKPLSPAEIDDLEKFLTSEDAPECSMNVSELHGFLTALAVGPALVLPSEWLREVWGAEGPIFDTEEQAQHILGLIFRLFGSISRTIEKAPDDFAPLLYEEDEEDGKTRPFAEDWCNGFSRGVALRGKDWEPLIRDEKTSTAVIAPIIAFTSADAMAKLLEKYGADMSSEKLISHLPSSVLAIYKYWEPQRRKHPFGPTVHTSPFGGPVSAIGTKVGRNAPCPCGSGKKYKKCCGAPRA
jgi:uncharacterized protein